MEIEPEYVAVSVGVSLAVGSHSHATRAEVGVF